MTSPEAQVKQWAAEAGFDDCRFAKAGTASHAQEFLDWIEHGKHGEMAWLERNPHRRCDPREVLPECRTVICLALNYFPGDKPFPENHPGGYRIARYAWNNDYHDLIEKKLSELDQKLQTLGGTQKFYVDTGPVLERDFASDAGLGWNGKSTMQIHRRLGTWFFLADILTTLDLTPDAPIRDHCGSCTRCMTACPTQAITAPRKLDARRCVSYLTIEHSGSIPEPLRPLIGNRIYGCDDCQLVCPWNKFAQAASHPQLRAVRNALDTATLIELFAWNAEEFELRLRGSAIRRIGHERWLRNIAVALGNCAAATGWSSTCSTQTSAGVDHAAGTHQAVVSALRARRQDPSALVREHVKWALSRHGVET